MASINYSADWGLLPQETLWITTTTVVLQLARFGHTALKFLSFEPSHCILPLLSLGHAAINNQIPLLLTDRTREGQQETSQPHGGKRRWLNNTIKRQLFWRKNRIWPPYVKCPRIRPQRNFDFTEKTQIWEKLQRNNTPFHRGLGTTYFGHTKNAIRLAIYYTKDEREQQTRQTQHSLLRV